VIDFLGIGAQKAGTTWLYERLSRHPALRFPAGKELHFWDRERERGVAWWLARFPDAADPAVRQGEITPAYALLDAGAIAEIRAHCPRLRLFMILRNPVERAWSAALMALGRAELEIDEASDAWFLDHFRSRGSLARGDYLGALCRWTSVFPREQLHVLLLDDVARDPRAALAALASHIGVDPRGFDALPDALLRERVYAGPGIPLRPSLAPALAELYAPRIRELARALGRDLGAWVPALG
jgi:hypothetical protein